LLLSHVLFLRFLAAAYGALGAFASTSIGLRALTVHGETAAVTDATIATDIHEPLDALGNFTAEVTLYLVLMFNDLAETSNGILGDVTNADEWVDTHFFDNLFGCGTSNTKDIRKSDSNTLISW
jgi:hypothetical protein